MRTRVEHDLRGRQRPAATSGYSTCPFPPTWSSRLCSQEMDQDVQRALTGIRLTDEGLIWLQPESVQTSRWRICRRRHG